MPLSAASQIVVLDLGQGLGAAIIAKHFCDLGSTVLRAEPPEGDPFYDHYPAYATLRRQERRIAVEEIEAAARRADILIVGGEDYPGEDWRIDAAALQAANPRLVAISLTGGVDAEGREQRAVDLLAQARSGLCWEQFADRPIAWALPGASYAMAVQALIGAWAALLEREDSGEGQRVEVSMQEGAAMLCMPDRISFERDDEISRAIIPYDVRQLIFPCRDGKYIQFAMQRPGALARVYSVLGIPGEVDPLDTGAKRPDSDPRDFFGDFELFERYVAQHDRETLLKAFWDNGIGADLVLAPGECWDDEQTRANDIIVTDAAGERSVGLPIRFTEMSNPLSPPDASGPALEPNRTAAPLAGKRVIAMGTFIAGPYVSRALAALGADVIKVDSPAGDPNTNLYTAWLTCNAGKRSIVIDVKTPEGRELLNRLCQGAEMIYNNFRPGVAERIGLDAGTLRTVAPHAVTLACSAYGPTGPKSSFPGLDPISQAVTGLEVRAGGPVEAPIWYRFPIVDYTTGALGSVALLIASYEHRLTGKAVHAEINLMKTALFLTSELVQRTDGRFEGAPSSDAEQLGYGPAERLYQTRDGWIAVAARGRPMERALARFANLGDRALEAEDTSRIAAAMRERGTAETLAALDAAGIWAANCPRYRGGLDRDPAAVRAGLVDQVEDPHYGRIVATAPLFRLSRSKVERNQLAPRLGEHTREILREIGCGEAEIDDYYRRGVVA